MTGTYRHIPTSSHPFKQTLIYIILNQKRKLYNLFFWSKRMGYERRGMNHSVMKDKRKLTLNDAIISFLYLIPFSVGYLYKKNVFNLLPHCTLTLHYHEDGFYSIHNDDLFFLFFFLTTCLHHSNCIEQSYVPRFIWLFFFAFPSSIICILCIHHPSYMYTCKSFVHFMNYFIFSHKFF